MSTASRFCFGGLHAAACPRDYESINPNTGPFVVNVGPFASENDYLQLVLHAKRVKLEVGFVLSGFSIVAGSDAQQRFEFSKTLISRGRLVDITPEHFELPNEDTELLPHERHCDRDFSIEYAVGYGSEGFYKNIIQFAWGIFPYKDFATGEFWLTVVPRVDTIDAANFWTDKNEGAFPHTRIGSYTAEFFDREVTLHLKSENINVSKPYSFSAFFRVSVDEEWQISAPARPAPTELSASRFGSSAVLNWAAAIGASLYTIYRSTTNNEADALTVGTTGGTTFDDSTVIAGTRYNYWIKATYPSGESDYSNRAVAIISPDLPGIPDGFTVEYNAISGVIQLTWSAAPGAEAYILRVGTTTDPDTASPLEITTATSFNTNSLPPGPQRYFFIRSFNITGTSDWNAVWIPAPAAPASIEATNTQPARIEVTWTAVPGATSYNVYRDGVLIAEDVTSLFYEDEDVVFHTTYLYAVSAENYSGESPLSAEDDGYALYPVPAAPLDVTATDGTLASQVLISWSPSTYAASYKVFRDGAEIGETEDTFFYDDIASGTIHSYSVKAVGESGTSPFSTSDNGHAAGMPDPANIAASDTDFDQVTITWDAVTEANSYSVLRNGVFIGNTAATSFNDTTAVPGVTYTYQVISVGALEESPGTGADTGIRPLLATPSVSATDGIPGGVEISWGTVTGALSYNVYRSGTFLANVAGTSYLDTGATICVTHNYSVEAVRGENLSSHGFDTGYTIESGDLCLTGGANSGSNAGTTDTYPICGPAEVSVYFNGGGLVADRLVVYIDASPVFDTGCTAGEYSGGFSVPSGAHTITVEVTVNCAGAGDTAWNYTLSC